jgi:ferredoxin-NADP reductase
MSATPDQPSARQRPHLTARIERIFDHCADTRSLFLRVNGDNPFRFIPGMFISVTIPLAEGTRVRPYTIASRIEDGQPLEICFNRVENGSGVAWLFERRAGEELDFTGPFGTFILDRPPEAEIIFICEGTAVAPIRPMLYRALAHDSPSALTLLYAADSSEHVLYRTELERLAAVHQRFHFETILERGRERIYEKLHAEAGRRWVAGDSGRNRHFYICGVGPGVLKLRDLLRGAGYERRSVHYEQW